LIISGSAQINKYWS